MAHCWHVSLLAPRLHIAGSLLALLHSPLAHRWLTLADRLLIAGHALAVIAGTLSSHTGSSLAHPAGIYHSLIAGHIAGHIAGTYRWWRITGAYHRHQWLIACTPPAHRAPALIALALRTHTHSHIALAHRTALRLVAPHWPTNCVAHHHTRDSHSCQQNCLSSLRKFLYRGFNGLQNPCTLGLYVS